MAPSPYIPEREVEHWTTLGIDRVFHEKEFEISSFPITQLLESKIPVDFLFLHNGTNKLFGLQFKVLYRNGRDFWNLNARQHRLMRSFDWIYYGLSELKDARHHRDALQHLRIVSPQFRFRPQIAAPSKAGTPPFVDWSTFFEGLEACTYGRRIENLDELHSALWPHRERLPKEITDVADQVFLVNFKEKRAAQFSGRVRPGDRATT
jgi:hypothetical protein